jgi:glycosyltransferase involved in cell wall biosynthesis
VITRLSLAGVGKLVAALSRRQIDAGHDVVIHTLDPPAVAPGELGNIEIVPSSPMPLPIRLYRLAKAFSASQPDVIHCHNIRPTLAGAPAARWAGVPAIVSTRHGLGMDSLRAAREFQYWLGARWCGAVAGVCEQSSGRIADAPGAQPHKIVTVPNGADPARRSPAGDLAPARQGFTLVNVANCNPVKDHSNLLRALALARRQSPDLHLWLIGGGADQDRLKILARELGLTEHVVFAGAQQFVGDWLIAADLFVLSSKSEGLPLALIEATAAGLPSVVTDVGGLPDVIRTCGVGTVVPPQSPSALSDAILQFVRRPPLLQSTRDSIRECYQRHYTLEAMAVRYEELYQRCAAK